MQIGTKSVLFGAHQFLIHPWFVAAAWRKLYGFPWERLWVAFFVHDLGYVGKPNMDGPEGEEHPWFGARICSWLFDTSIVFPSWFAKSFGRALDVMFGQDAQGMNWFSLLLYHSRYLAKKYGLTGVSRLCVADKLAIALTPAWLYLPMVRLTGEIDEYMGRATTRCLRNAHVGAAERESILSGDQQKWYAGVQAYLRRWAEEHRDGREDRWTATGRQADSVGVWR